MTNNLEFRLSAQYQPENALTLVKLARLMYQGEEEISQQVASWGFSQFTFITTPTPL
jgi:hypothetical protein